MSREFGIFGDEGLIEGDFWSLEEASSVVEDRYREDKDDLEILLICPYHREQPAGECWECGDNDELEEDEEE